MPWGDAPGYYMPRPWRLDVGLKPFPALRTQTMFEKHFSLLSA